MSGTKQDEDNRCTFCGRPRRADRLISGPPGVAICLDCLEICNNLTGRDKTGVGGTKRGGFDKVAIARKLPTPSTIKKRLEEYVVGQERTKKILSVAVNNHYKRILNPRPAADVEIEKSNVLLIGPTGCGKTLLARTLAKILNVPFAIGDATTLTEAGYVGEDVENLLLRLIQTADFDLDRAERGIIYIDEIDKIGRTHENPSITRDVSGEGVQQGLLKILEGTVSNVPPQGGRKHPEQEYIRIDTTHILFFAGGTFDGIEHIINRRVGRKQIGFKADTANIDEMSLGDILERVEPEDLMEFGMIPEFIGRFPVICVVRPLPLAALIKILTEPKNALARQYQELFRLDNAELQFSQDALEEIARRALEKKTGARALRAIMEKLMLDVMFELPNTKQSRTYHITDKMVRGEEDIKPESVKKAGPSKEIA